MINVAEIVERVVALAAPSPATVSAVLNVKLAEKPGGPHWVEYGCGPSGDLVGVRLTLGRRDGKWHLFIQYDPAHAPVEASIDLEPYGPITNMDVNPRVPPEGTVSYTYRYRELDVSIEFTSQTRRLRSLSFVRE